MKFNEDTRVKIPTILHLIRLGYTYLSLRGKYSTEFIYYTVKNSMKTIELNSSGSTFKEISTSIMKTIRTILPLEKLLVSYDELIEPIFNKQDTLERENQKLSELRDWLLPMLMNGQVRVGDKKNE